MSYFQIYSYQAISIFAPMQDLGYLLHCALRLCRSLILVLSTLQSSCPPVGDSFGNPTGRLFWEPMKTSDIKWNFEKFLVGPNGKPVMRWHPSVNISEVRADIRKYLLQLYTQDIYS